MGLGGEGGPLSKKKTLFVLSPTSYISNTLKPMETELLKIPTYHSEVFKEFDDGRVEEVVAPTVGNKGLNDGGEEVVSHDVAIVKLIFETHNLSTEPKSS